MTLKRSEGQEPHVEAPIPGDGALGVFFPNEVNLPIDKWRRIYLPQYREIPPHITVVYPPFVLLDEWPSVRTAVAECLGTFHPFDVTLKELGTFAGPPHVLWLKPEDGGNLSRIHAALVERCPSYVSDPDSYVPHVTVGLFDSEKGLSKAREAMQAEIVPLHFRADELSYVVRGEDGVWHIHERLFLG
jgi:2'-5' RNA ligase